jgi:aspartate aminotransferase-like enzyme
MQLRIPGPTPLPDEVLDAMHRPMISHREGEFRAMLFDITEHLKCSFQTEGDVLVFPGVGTGGMEAAIANLFSPGDRVICASAGAFGDRFGEIASRFGLDIVYVRSRWGEAIDLQALEVSLEVMGKVAGVLLTHNETSTGVQHDIEAASRLVRGSGNPDALVVVDAISSMGAVDIPVDRWEIDVAITASQKAWMAPPGLTMLSVSERAWAATERATLPHYYWDFQAARRFARRGETPYTPAVGLLFGLQASLHMLAGEGLARVFARHTELRDRVRQLARRAGLVPLASDEIASRTVTALRVPEGMRARQVTELMRERGVIVAGGQGALEDAIIRIGHMGFVSPGDIDVTMLALAQVTGELSMSDGRELVPSTAGAA